jgi:hypothetical protein
MDGTVVAWGRKTENQTNLPALKNVWAIAANPSSNISFAILQDGRIETWGTYGAHKAWIPSGLRNVIKIEPGKQRHWSISSGQ